MVNADRATSQQAPGTVEQVRELLNTWLIPNDTRRPTDRFAQYARQHRLTREEQTRMRHLRDDLRAVVERAPDADERLNDWLQRVDIQVAIQHGKLKFRRPTGPVADLMIAVVEAVNAGHWHRLKACPDCRWIFYDHTRNASKRWCLMNAGGPNGRACGTIAKVRSHRQRQTARSASPAATRRC